MNNRRDGFGAGLTKFALATIPPCLSENDQGLVSLTVYVQPRASRISVIGLHDGRLKLAITAPPVEGQANNQVIAFLAKLFRVAKGSISLESGSLGRSKRLTIAGISLEQAAIILAPLL
ncbi:MAG: YggU family protein [Desulfobulbaceae bacterium]|nr:YggU family protein [Desulfobulbaceae bacterium]